MPADPQQRHRVRVFVDFWNYTLTMRDHVDPTFATDWAKLGPALARTAVAEVDATATGEYQGLNFYGSYDRTKEKKLHRWATTVVDTFPGVTVSMVRRQKKRSPPKCPTCLEPVDICPSCGADMRGTEEKGVEFLIALPTIPVWMALAAALPPGWESVKIYFGITIILSIVGWTGLARVVRGKLLELREADFVMAARVAGAREGRIIALHLLPSFLSYLIVHLTLAIPGMILGETALSFLGLGIRPPAVSWGTLLQDAQSVQTVILYPWLMLPALSVVAAVLMFNFLGDGLRDAADPYKAG